LQNHPSGAKALHSIGTTSGTAKAVPFQSKNLPDFSFMRLPWAKGRARRAERQLRESEVAFARAMEEGGCIFA
jgi:hypothetical protein